MRVLLLIFLISGISAAAQKNLTINEAINEARTTLAPKSLRNLTFRDDRGNLVYTTDNNQVVQVSPNGKKSVLFDLTALNRMLKTFDPVKDSLKQIPGYYFLNPNVLVFTNSYPNLVVDLKKKNIIDRSSDKEMKALNSSKKLKSHLKLIGMNLHVAEENKTTAITTDGSEDLVYGKSVHREEFGIETGIFHNHDSSFAAFYRMDQSMVNLYPIIRWGNRPAKNENIRYPFAGEKSHQVSIGVYNFKDNKTIYLNIEGDKEQYLTNIAFSPTENAVYVAIVNRAQNHMQLNAYDAVSGKFLKTLFEEKDEKYVEPMHPAQFLPKTPNTFIWESRKDGYRHLYLYDINGKEIKQLTKGKWEIKDHLGFDKSGKHFLFTANITSPIDHNLCKVDVQSGKITVLTPEKGTSFPILDQQKQFAIVHYSDIETPRIIRLLDVNTGKQTELFRAEDPLKAYKKGQLKIFPIASHHEDSLYCRMYLPVDFDAKKKYPVVVYLYNGPHSQMVSNSWLSGTDLWYHYMAQRGFIMFTLDGRGTAYRGKKFEQAIHRQLGTPEMEDQLCGVNYLKTLPYVDTNRMGVHGWSYGGFMTSSLMTRYPNVFKAGVAGGPVIDWSYYEIMYGERYMDSPQENPDGYKNNNVLNHIGNLKGKLLLIHGTDDNVVVWQHSIMLLQKSVEANVHLDYFVYPGYEHNVRDKNRAHLMDKISNYFFEHLKE
jgi:dipeptidyl-peptidase-4